jgi:hypothetical protein
VSGTVALNAAGNAVANAGIGAVFGAVQNLDKGQCIDDGLWRQAGLNATLGAAGGYIGARVGLAAPVIGSRVQGALNEFGNILLPKGPPFAGPGPYGATAAGLVTGMGTTFGEFVSNFGNVAP